MGDAMQLPWDSARTRNTVARGIRRWYGNDESERLSYEQFDWFARDAMGMGPELLGVCKQCGEVQSPVEPDATGNPCQACDAKAVMGFGEVVIYGFEG